MSEKLVSTMSSDGEWVIKLEYCIDKNESYVDESFVADFDECPLYDPEKSYKAFWSPIDKDTPSDMLKRVPKIPFLTDKEQKACKPGYYDAVILGVKSNVTSPAASVWSMCHALFTFHKCSHCFHLFQRAVRNLNLNVFPSTLHVARII